MPQKSGKYFPLTGDRLIDSLTNGYVWDTSASNLIGYSVSRSFETSGGLSFIFNSSVATNLTAQLRIIETYIDLDFIFVGNFSGEGESPATALLAGSSINIAPTYVSPTSLWGWGYFPNDLDVNRGDIYQPQFRSSMGIVFSRRKWLVFNAS